MEKYIDTENAKPTFAICKFLKIQRITSDIEVMKPLLATKDKMPCSI